MLCCYQRGYAVLFMLVILLSASAALLKSLPIYPSGASVLSSVVAQQRVLQRARQSLLSYSVIYPWLYGPQGAGPGHLPCPDTDYVTRVVELNLQSNDGPNPPCGQQQTSTGQLPRRVSLSGRRYAFSDLATNRLDYKVDSRVINNPVNRLVNPSMLSDDNQQTSILATISVANQNDVRRSSNSFSSVITLNALQLGIRHSVAAWAIARFDSLGSARCTPSGSDKLLLESSLADRCQNIQQLIAQCGNGQLTIEPYSDKPRVESDQTQAIFLLLMLADSLLDVNHCPDDIVSSLTLERVPMKRHWFYRNQWHQWLRVELIKGCNLPAADGCKLVFQNRQALTQLSEPMVLQYSQ